MFYSIPNLRSSAAVELPAPWDYKPTCQPPYGDKVKLIAWSQDFATQHAFISTYEAMSQGVRVTTVDNPPFKLHGFIVDYDGKSPEGILEFLKTKPACEFLPNYLVETASGNNRLIWIFERPLLLASLKQIKEFLKTANKHLKLPKWLPGLDTEAFGSPDRYYEIGKAWHPVFPEARIPAGIIELWLLKASASLKFDEKQFDYKIPIEALAKELEARFPGRWSGRFDLGARGLRFWDATADNETAAIVREDGMICFTGDQGFVSWKQIFGAPFVEQFEADYVSGIVNESAYAGNSFWHEDSGVWREWNKDDFAQELRVRGYEGRKKQGQTASEIDMIENAIKKNRWVSRALPYMFMDTGIINVRGERYLNISRVAPIAPAPPLTDGPMTFSKGREHFKLIYTLLRTMFLEIASEEDRQLTAFLAWTKYFYVHALNKDPAPGHTIVIAGPPGKGKTLLSKEILGGLMGGECDASSHFVDGDPWTERLCNSPIARVDDSLAITDPRGLLKFSNRLKKYTANAEMMYNQKFKQTGSIPWFGRAVVTCNLDSESLRILPDMDLSTRDKISLFKASDHIMKFDDWKTTGETIRRELPAFARFLYDWTIPSEWIADERRFGVRPFHHPDLFDESRQQGLGVILELLHMFMESWRGAHPTKEFWEGTATTLCQDLATINPSGMRDLKPHQVAIMLGKLSKNDFPVHKYKDPMSRLNMWRISVNIGNVTPEAE